MVAPVDTFVYFTSTELHEQFQELLEVRSSAGGGLVIASLVLNEVAAAVESARAHVGDAPLGFVTSSEGDALEAILAGADEAMMLCDENTETLTSFLDRLRVRARIRQVAKRNDRDFVQAEKLTALGTLVAGVGHELNNPLSSITLGFDVLRGVLLPDLEVIWAARDRVAEDGSISQEDAELLLNKLKANMMDVRGLIADLTQSADAVSQLVQDLRVFSRDNVVEQPALFSPTSVIEQALRLVRREFGPSTIVEQDYEQWLPDLFLARNRLAQVLTNLLVNAAHAMRDSERKVHRIKVSARIDDQHLAISIADTGPGIAEDVLERIFDPFFTTKRENQGTGLGLSISRSIIQHMGGDLVVSSILGEGATFVCFLPLPTQEQLALRPRLHAPLVSPRHDNAVHGSVLLIDDDERILRATARSLKENYKVLIARDGEEARELLESGSHADAIVMELDLPELDGPNFYAWLKKNRPALASKIVVATAAQEREKYRTFLKSNSLVVLLKPLAKEALLEALGQVVAA